MQKIAILLLWVWTCLPASSAFADERVPFKWGMGLGLESRLEREVNPDFADMREVGMIFQSFRRGPWGALGEFSLERANSGSGGLEIQTQSAGIGVWGRYSFFEPDHWSPFATAGFGGYFDRITSSYGEQIDIRRGRRAMIGAGAGITNVFWGYLFVEGEVRGTVVQDRKEPGAAFLLRAGVQL